MKLASKRIYLSMNAKKTMMKWVKLSICLMVFSMVVLLLKSTVAEYRESWWSDVREELEHVMERKIMETHLPVFLYTQTDAGFEGIPKRILLQNTPVLQRIQEEQKIEVATQSNHTIDEIIRSEGNDEDNDTSEDLSMKKDSEGIIHLSIDMEEHVKEENNVAKENDLAKKKEDETEVGADSNYLALAREKKQEYQWDYYSTMENIIKDFYAIDSTTNLKENELSIEKLMKPDMTLKGDNSNPQILIYHTHSQEAFADSVPGDASTTIMGAGERLTELLRERYGFNVIHHTGEYDVEARDYAYSYALPQIEQVLADNPSIEVVIDLHRDEAKEDNRLVTEINGKPTAKFMFFNGLSRTKKQGEIEYLSNPYIQENLAFSFQMQVLCNEYYPGVTRRIYLKGYRYNMHLCPKTLLIEMGAQNNTREEIWNAIEILADVLNKELTGVDR